MNALLALFILPFVAALWAFIQPRMNRTTAALLSLLPLILLLTSIVVGASVELAWLSSLSIHLHLQVDNLSLIFLYIVAVIVPISILSQDEVVRPNFFYGLILLLQGLLIGFFTSRDLVLFVFFFEAILLPLYFLISSWGGPQREKAAFTFIVYMVAGSTLMIAALLSLYYTSESTLGAGTFSLDLLTPVAETLPYAPLLAFIFLLAFMVKTPLFPFHAWLPDAYCQAPVAGTILLSAILSKAGIYGILRLSYGLYPHILQEWCPYLVIIAIVGMLYGAFAAWAQTDYKRLIAYSSLSHVNFILAGVFVWNQMAQSGAILQALNHSLTITALFLVAGWLEKRIATTSITTFTGLSHYMPRLGWLTIFFVLSSVALPGLNTFVSEVMLLYGVFQENFYLAGALGLTVIFSVIYMLRWIHTSYFETPTPYKASLVDLRGSEMLLSIPLVALVLWLGMYPKPALERVVPAADNILLMEKKL